ncbi:hypothetical protein AJ78_00446 [Emergomyces pasteurianus Ep9510]|uniref:Uncharacterized protein n=1 Tax=Emergomyces pasteurianus Ep9510 TaxID=1447872 RepID=A0A1J9QWA6_9EURO|nr:hypothetical protein AJ78_00446 [Emergomyces pasteurianus Ep9510]
MALGVAPPRSATYCRCRKHERSVMTSESFLLLDRNLGNVYALGAAAYLSLCDSLEGGWNSSCVIGLENRVEYSFRRGAARTCLVRMKVAGIWEELCLVTEYMLHSESAGKTELYKSLTLPYSAIELHVVYAGLGHVKPRALDALCVITFTANHPVRNWPVNSLFEAAAGLGNSTA